jgi:hypothetical protein
MRLRNLLIGVLFAASACTSTAYNPGTGGGGAGGSGGAGGGGAGGAGGATGGGGGAGGGGAGGGAGSGGGGGGTSTTKTGTISSDETWSGFLSVTGDVTIASGVTVTIADGALIKVAMGHGITVAGTLKVTGTAAGGVKLQPDPMPSAWNGISVSSGGSVDIAYAELDYPSTGLTCATGTVGCKADHLQILNYSGSGLAVSSKATFSYLHVENMAGGGGGIFISAGATDLVTITDSTFHNTGGDAVVCDSGNLTLQYSHMYGSAAGGNSGVHCATHFGTSGVILADHNIMEDVNYGLMASGLDPTSKINMNNFIGYGTPTTPGGAGGAWGPAGAGGINSSVDVTNNYWSGGVPTGIGTSKTSTTYTTAIPGLGPR